ncbi:MAG: YfiR family protein [Moraxellaceae bacterium]|nr:YfiR family protein [Moraxellaceae bacterium]
MALLNLLSCGACRGRRIATACRAGIAVLALLAGGQATAKPSLEYQLKAVFLYRFSQFVEWPQQAFASAQAPLSVCVLGDDPFGDYLDETVQGEVVKGHPLQVQRYRHVDEVGACHILFVSDSEQANLKGILESLHGRNILTVSNGDSFVRGGGIIGFMLEDRRIRLWINPEAARSAGLRISSKLLRASELATPGG